MSNVVAKIQHLIFVMESVGKIGGKLKMQEWYSKVYEHNGDEYFEGLGYSEVDQTKGVEGLHSCGTAACFAGWCALDPEVLACDSGEEPIHAVTEYVLADCAQKWKGDVRVKLEQIACYDIFYDGANGLNKFYGVPMKYITIEMVIEKLKELKEYCFINGI